VNDQPTGIREDDLGIDPDCLPGIYYCEEAGVMAEDIIEVAEFYESGADPGVFWKPAKRVTAAFAVFASGHDWFHWFLEMLPWNCAFSIATMVGRAIVRTRRSAVTTRPSAT